MNKLFISLGIFIALSLSRFLPHPPNFTSLIALSFYVPAIFGPRYLPVLIFSFAITDIIIGLHQVVFFTWGSVFIIGLTSKYFSESISKRFAGAILGSFIFFVITNFGIWSLGYYGYSLNSFFYNYLLSLPFFGYNLISTIIFSIMIEALYFIMSKNIKLKIKKN